jgi:hypothetical protein
MTHLSLQIGDTHDECVAAARKMVEPLLAAQGWVWAGTNTQLVHPEDIERLNREAGATAIQFWPDFLPEQD